MNNIKNYNKLVRDNILEIIKKNNQKCVYHIAGSSEYKEKLLDKLIEEVNEFKLDKTKEEMSDILEVIDSIIEAYEIDIQSLHETKRKKAIEKCKFKNKIILDFTFSD